MQTMSGVNIFSDYWPKLLRLFLLFTQLFPEHKPPSTGPSDKLDYKNMNRMNSWLIMGMFCLLITYSWVCDGLLKVVLSLGPGSHPAALTYNRHTWPHACAHCALAVHPIQLELELWWPSLHMASCSQRFSEKSRQLPHIKKNTQRLTHLNVAPKGHQHSSPPSLFSASHNIYSKHMSSPIQELKPWRRGEMQTSLLTNVWKTRQTQCACQAGNEERGGGGEQKRRRPFSFSFSFFRLCLQKHLLSGIWCHARFSPPQSKLD